MLGRMMIQPNFIYKDHLANQDKLSNEKGANIIYNENGANNI